MLPTSESPPPAALLLYGEERANAVLADELALDGYEVRRASDPARLRAACAACEVELVIFGRATRRGAGLDVLRALRAGAFSPELAPGSRTLWMSPNDDLGDVLRGFEAGADDVLRRPFAYTELLARVRALVRRDLAELPDVIEYGKLRIDTTAHEVTSERRTSVCAAWSTRCWYILRANLPVSTPRTSCCKKCGAFAQTARRGPLPPTPRACDARSRGPVPMAG